MAEGIKRKTSSISISKSQPKSISSKRSTLSGGKKVKSASRASASRAKSSGASKSMALALKGLKESSSKFIKQHRIEDGIKSALIEFIKKYKF